MAKTALATRPKSDLLELRTACQRALPKLKSDLGKAWAAWYGAAGNDRLRQRAHREYIAAIMAMNEVKMEIQRINRALVLG